MATTKRTGETRTGEPARAELPPQMADLQRLLAGGRPAKRTALAVKGTNALVAVVDFFAAAMTEELDAGAAREAALTERLAAAERALVAKAERPAS